MNLSRRLRDLEARLLLCLLCDLDRRELVRALRQRRPPRIWRFGPHRGYIMLGED